MKPQTFKLGLMLGLFLMGSTEVAFSQTNFWQQTNGPYHGGSIGSLAIKSTGVIFAGTSLGGVFRSSDKGDSWTQVNVELPNDIRCLAIDADGQVLAGSNGFGIFRSSNDGDSWTRLNNGLTNIQIFALAINASAHIFAGTYGGGVFRSTDNGSSWAPVNSGLTNAMIRR